MRTAFHKTLSTLALGWIFLILLPFYINAQECEMRKRDFEMVTEFLNSKRTIDWAEKHAYLKLSGDIKAQFLRRIEKNNGHYLRGHNNFHNESLNFPFPLNPDTYEAVLNTRWDYKCGRSWMAGYLQFDNHMGTRFKPTVCIDDPNGCSGSGECDDICIKRAYAGYNFIDCDDLVFDLEMGRRPMYTIFDSRIEFHARFDGLLFKLSKIVKDKGKFYANGGPFVVDFRVNHYAYIIETGVLDFYQSNFDIKYSFIDWRKHGKNRCLILDAQGWRFKNSQLSLAYNINPKYIPAVCKKARLYGAFLYNHTAHGLDKFDNVITITDFRKQNDAWYAGLIIGEVRKKGDWSVDINYQYVRAQAIPECDMHGIGRGTVAEPFLKTGLGKGNYKGWHFEGLYAVTDKLSLDFLYEFSNEIEKKIGGSVLYHRYEFDVIHAF